MSDIEMVDVRDSELEAVWATFEDSGVAGIISTYALCHSLFAFAESGMAKKLAVEGVASRRDLLEGVDAHLGEHLLRYLAIHGIVEPAGDGYRTTAKGRALSSDVAMAQLGMYRGAYGPVFERMTGLLEGQEHYGKEVIRNGAALSRHSAVLFHTFHTPIVLRAIHDWGASRVLDLGCGAGRSLIDACKRDPLFRGVGLDISPDAIAVANKLARAEGVADRLEFVVGDAFRPDTWPEACHRADGLLAVGVLHEHFREGEQAVVRLLDTLADLVATRWKGFLLGEPELRYDAAGNDPDFYLAHIFTNQGFPMRRERWLELFPKTKLRCRRVLHRVGYGPRLVFYDLESGRR